MLRVSILVAAVAAASAFTAPASILRSSSRSAISRGPTMQLWKDGIEQGLGVLAIPGTERPKNLDGTLPGDIGFDPLGFSNVIDIKWLREAELKHARVAMLAFLGFIVQEFYTIPGFDKVFNGASALKLHNLAVEQGALQQVSLWVHLIELITGVPALIQTLSGSERAPGDFGFDPLNLAKNPDQFAYNQLAELKNGRMAMIAVGGITHHYLITGRGPIDFITNPFGERLSNGLFEVN